ncbi:hypothetical protein [Frankia sp. EAN1pec]|uniref:hypothetical protein n=1 Tax=Parafrankia sp. (strain EAN1pec) TaxID=298653 RepID=UPI0012FAD8A2
MDGEITSPARRTARIFDGHQQSAATVHQTTGGFSMPDLRRLASLLAATAVVAVGFAPASTAGGPSEFNDCTTVAPCLLLTFDTGGDDLRGGGSDLNISIDTRAHSLRSINNVNLSSNWSNNSRHTVGVDLVKHFGAGILAEEITTVSLGVTTLAGNPFQSPDNWNLDSVTVQYQVSNGAPRTLRQTYPAAPFRFTGANSSRDVRIDGLLDSGFEWQGSRIGAPWTTEGPDAKGVDVNLGLARNPGFDNHNNAWIRTSSQNWNAVLQTIPVTPNQNYVLRGWIRTSGHGVGADVNTAFFGVRMSGLWPPDEQHFGPSPAGQYQEIIQPFNPGNRTSVTVFCGFWGLGRDGWIQIDQLSVLPV